MQTFVLEVTGDFACFSRPEMSVERVSYDVMTPSAARAICESILWKPAIFWQVERIEVLAPICWTTLRRNEVGSKVPLNSVTSAMKKGQGALGLYVEEDRQQRASLLLRDVTYRLHARFKLTDKAGHEDSVEKFTEMFRRRASKGQCINQPYLGCREFACDFRLIAPSQAATPCHSSLQGTRDLGWMLYDMDFAQPDNPTPRFFRARMVDGVVSIPDWHSEEVRG